MKNEQDREQLQRYFGQGNNSDPLKNSNRPKRSEDLSFDRTQWFVSEGRMRRILKGKSHSRRRISFQTVAKRKNADSPV